MMANMTRDVGGLSFISFITLKSFQRSINFNANLYKRKIIIPSFSLGKQFVPVVFNEGSICLAGGEEEREENQIYL